MAGIEELVRQHIAQNQQNLQQTQERQNAYTGPTMPEIRKDPATQSKVADIMAAIKAASPVFGQTPANLPPVQPQTPLEQLQQLILGQQHQSSATAHPLPSTPLQPQIHNHLDQLQQLLNQQSQNLGAGSLYTPQFTHQTFQPPVNQVQQLLQELSRTNLPTTTLIILLYKTNYSNPDKTLSLSSCQLCPHSNKSRCPLHLQPTQ